jgi:diphthine-ammonia ligase
MRATVLWTGGKDSAMAFYKARSAGHDVVNLLTFVPEKADFLAHPLRFMKYQAKAIDIPHYEAVVTAPLEDGYEKAIRAFKNKHKIDVFITGDMAEVDAMPNWIRQRCKSSGVEVITPLWGVDRRKAFTELLSCGFKAMISCVKIGSLGEEWLGRELDKKALDELSAINKKTGLDICGEQGEYHTLVLDGPIFKRSVVVGNFYKHSNSLVRYIKTNSINLKAKA